MTGIRIRALLPLLLPTLFMPAEVGALTWSQWWSGRASELHALAPSADGGFCAAGRGYGGDEGMDAWMARFDAYGDVLWMRRLRVDGDGPESLRAVTGAPDGGCVGLGYHHSPLPDVSVDAWIIRLDHQGRIDWQWRIGGEHYCTSSDLVGTIETTSDGGYIASVNPQTNSIQSDALVMKLSGSGAIQWQKRYGGDIGSVGLFSMREVRDGGFIGVGFNTDTREDGWVVRLREDGSILWERGYSTTQPERGQWPLDVLETGDSGFAIGGGTVGFWGGGETGVGFIAQATVMKLDSQGAFQWRKEYGEFGTARFHPLLRRTPDDGLILLVRAENIPPDSEDMIWLLKLDPHGSIVWQRAFRVEDPALPRAIAVTPEGDFIVSATTHTFVQSGQTPWLSRIGATGGFDADCPWGEDTHEMERLAPTSIRDVSTPVTDSFLLPIATHAVARDPETEIHRLCCWERRTLPHEVSPRGTSEPLRFLDRTTLTWQSVMKVGENEEGGGSCLQNLYRGSVWDLPSSYGTCLLADIPITTNEISDPEFPVSGECWFYLVTGENSAGEGPMGWTSSGTLRPNTHPCP